MYGIAVAALGMPSTIATGLAIHAYGPISDNAGGIAEMAVISHRIHERTDALDAAGNTLLLSESLLFGFIFPLLWYYATTLYFRNYYQKDPRERTGLAASAITGRMTKGHLGI
ncbi:putative inorganic diphosphatase [Helianthus debilis subsp. tardiflorus]